MNIIRDDEAERPQLLKVDSEFENIQSTQQSHMESLKLCMLRLGWRFLLMLNQALKLMLLKPLVHGEIKNDWKSSIKWDGIIEY
jgi:hypothetical protein